MKTKITLPLIIGTSFCMLGTLLAPTFKDAKAEESVTFDEFKENWLTTNASFSLGGSENQVIVEQDAESVSAYADKNNQWSRIVYKNPINISDNGINTPFIQFSINSHDTTKYDFEAIIVTLSNLADLSKATEAVSVIMFLGNSNGALNASNWCFAAKGISATQTTKQRFSGYACDSKDNTGYVYWDGVTDWLTNSDQHSVGDVGSHIGLYYDAETKCVWTDNVWSKVANRLTDEYKAKVDSSSYNRVMIRNLTHDNSWTPNPGSKSGTYSNGFGDAFNTKLSNVYLSVTTVRSFNNYVDPFSDQIPLATTGTMFKGVARDSGYGARYFIRSIDGCSTTTTDGVFTNDRIKVTADDPTYNGSVVEAKQPYSAGVFKFMSKTDAYMKVIGPDQQEVAMQGLNEGKWASGCSFAPTKAGVYKIQYCSDAERESVTLTKEISFSKVTFKSDETSSSDTIVLTGEKVAKPENPSKEGYEFIAWYQGEEKFNFDTAITEDIVLVAKYSEKQYVVQFVAEGEVIKTDYFTYTQRTVVEPEVPEKTGYTGTWEPYTLTPSDKPIIVNAVYTANKYTLSFSGGETAVNSIEVTYKEKITDLPDVPTKTGHTGVWKLDGAVITKDTVWEETENKTAVAYYTINIYTVMFDGADVEAQNVDYGGKVTKPVDPKKDGYTFEGWYHGDELWDFDNDTVQGNMVLTAHFKLVPPKSGCGGNIVATSLILSSIALAGVAILVIRKRKEN